MRKKSELFGIVCFVFFLVFALSLFWLNVNLLTWVSGVLASGTGLVSIYFNRKESREN